MGDTPKVTKEMVKGEEKIPAGFEIRDIKHDEYSYTHPASGKKVTVKAHTEHVLKSTAAATPKAKVNGKAKTAAKGKKGGKASK